jgi:hypothetical protein
MAFDFPSSPTLGQQFSPVAGTTYAWNGYSWLLLTAGSSPLPANPAIGFSAHKNGVDQTGLVSGSFTKITFTTEVYDNGGYYDAANSRWTPPAGIVHIEFQSLISGVTAASGLEAGIFKNGAINKRGVNVAVSTSDGCKVSLDDIANGADYYEAVVLYTGSGGAANGYFGYTYFSGHVVSPTGATGATGAPGTSLAAPTAPQGRLTLQTNTPVMVTDSSGLNTIRYTPYVGDRIPICDGTQMVMTGFTELSCTTTDTTKNPSAIGAAKINDWFVWNDAGTIRLGHGVDWPNDTGRFGPSGIQRINGIWVNAAAITNGPAAARGTYVGTTRSGGNDSLFYWRFGGTGLQGAMETYFGVWNCYNRVAVVGVVRDTSANYVPPAGYRPLNNSVMNRAYAIFGLAEDAVEVNLNAVVNSNATAGVAVGFNSTTTIG